jgi:hypothetical protein
MRRAGRAALLSRVPPPRAHTCSVSPRRARAARRRQRRRKSVRAPTSGVHRGYGRSGADSPRSALAPVRVGRSALRVSGASRRGARGVRPGARDPRDRLAEVAGQGGGRDERVREERQREHHDVLDAGDRTETPSSVPSQRIARANTSSTANAVIACGTSAWERDARHRQRAEAVQNAVGRSAHRSRLLGGSRPVVGSSRNGTGGAATRPGARSSRRRVRPEYVRTRRSAPGRRYTRDPDRRGGARDRGRRGVRGGGDAACASLGRAAMTIGSSRPEVGPRDVDLGGAWVGGSAVRSVAIAGGRWAGRPGSSRPWSRLASRPAPARCPGKASGKSRAPWPRTTGTTMSWISSTRSWSSRISALNQMVPVRCRRRRLRAAALPQRRPPCRLAVRHVVTLTAYRLLGAPLPACGLSFLGRKPEFTQECLDPALGLHRSDPVSANPTARAYAGRFRPRAGAGGAARPGALGDTRTR